MARREFQVNLSAHPPLLPVRRASLDTGANARQGVSEPAGVIRAGGRQGARRLCSHRSRAVVDGCLNNPDSGHCLITERLVYPLDKLWNGILHFERFCGVHLQVKHGGGHSFWEIRLGCSFRQFRGHCVRGERRPRYGGPLSKHSRHDWPAPAQGFSGDRRHKPSNRDGAGIVGNGLRGGRGIAMSGRDCHT
jgi:hypothetical protein